MSVCSHLGRNVSWTMRRIRLDAHHNQERPFLVTLHNQLVNLLGLDQTQFKECLHSARRTAAAGASGMTVEQIEADIGICVRTMSRVVLW